MDLKIGDCGEVMLPGDVRQRYGLEPDTRLRLIEAEGGILLVPMTGAPSKLEGELQQWQAIGAESWDLFPYEDEG